MDLSFSRFEHDASPTVLPPDLAVMMVGIAARQAASPTAQRQAALQSHVAGVAIADDPFAPAHGAFNARVAAALIDWRTNMTTALTEPL